MYTRVVASLIATLFVSFILYSTPVEAGSKNELSFNGSVQTDLGSKNAASAVTVPSGKKFASFQAVPVYRTPDGLYTLSPVAGAVLAFTGYTPGTPGAIPGRINSDGSLVMPKGKRGVMYPDFTLMHAIYNPLVGAMAPTGTRLIHEVLAPVGTAGDHRTLGAATTWPNAQAVVTANPGTGAFVTETGDAWVGPTEVAGVWVNNEYPTDNAVISGRGEFVSRFDFALSSYPREDLVSDRVNRFSDYDQSRDTFYAPGYAGRVTVQAKAMTVTTVATQVVSFRLATLVHERTGKVYHMDSYARSGRIWVWDPQNPNDPNPEVLTQLSTNDRNIEAQLSGRMYNDMLFRFVAVNSFQAARLEVWNVVTKLKVAEYPINAQVADGGDVQDPRGEFSFDPRRNTVWIASARTGKVYTLDLNNGALQNVPVPAVGVGCPASVPRDVAVDSARDVAFVVVMACGANGLVNYEPGRVVEVSLETKALTGRSVQVGIAPWSIAIAPLHGVNHLFITNSADGGNNQLGDDSLSVVDTATMTEALPRLVTRNQPTNLVVELKD